jgi:Uncharacterised protein family (UPF0158)
MTYSDFENAFQFVSSAPPGEHYAIINRVTGESFLRSDLLNEDDIPEDADENDDYIVVPHKNELDLGKVLVMEFVSEVSPEEYAHVQGFFSRKGAYRRYKDFLEEKGLLESWYAFENQRTKEALLGWCEENEIVLEQGQQQVNHGGTGDTEKAL